MSVTHAPATTGEVVVFKPRRNVELALVLFAQSFGLAGWVLAWLNIYNELPSNLPIVAGLWYGLGLLAHVVVRWRARYADPILLPCALLFNGLGLAMIARIDQVPDPTTDRATSQLILTAAAIVMFCATLALVKDHRRLQRFPYILFGVGVLLLLLPLIPGLGVQIYGARIWIRLGPFSFQPAEIAKIVLAISFASYFVAKRDVLSLAGNRFLGLTLPRGRDLGPIIGMWLISLGIMVFQNDLGTAVLIFGLFVVMIYVATERPAYPILGGIGVLLGGVLAYKFTNHVARRVNAWLDPFSDYDKNLQIISGQFGLAWGGLFGTGWGLGRPTLTPLSWSDFIATSLGEEIGIVGLMAIVMLYGLLVARGMKTALMCPDSFGKLLAGGLAATFGLQVFLILGGVTRLLPLTGLTTPFMSQGGSALISNWIVVGLLLVISNRARMPHVATATPTELSAEGMVSR